MIYLLSPASRLLQLNICYIRTVERSCVYPCPSNVFWWRLQATSLICYIYYDLISHPWQQSSVPLVVWISPSFYDAVS